jgi:alkyldihydroxyacetonephosphate synthase
LYETGAAIYVYFSIKYDNFPLDKVCDIYEEIEHSARNLVMKYGGSISHHHGVGKLRKRFMEKSFTDINMFGTMYDGIKNSVDPDNIFAVNNTIYRSEKERKQDLEHIKSK